MSTETPAAPHAREIVERLCQEAIVRYTDSESEFDREKAQEILQEWEAAIRAQPEKAKIPYIGEV